MAPASLASRPPLSNADRLHIREQVEKTTRALLAEGVFHALYSEVNQSNPRMSRLRETVIAAEALLSQVEMHHHKNRDECLGYFQTLVDGRRISMDAYNAVSVGYDELLLALSQAQERINERYRLLDAEYHRLIQAYKAAAV